MIRAARPDDAGALAAIYRPYVTDGTISFEDEAPDAVAMRARMVSSDDLYPWLVATGEDDRALAYAHASAWSARSAYRWTVETTIYVATHGCRRGIGGALYRALLASLSRQGFTQAIGRISLPNTPSVAFHEALGFRCTGVMAKVGWKAGRWIDVGLWQRELARPDDPPYEPRPDAKSS